MGRSRHMPNINPVPIRINHINPKIHGSSTFLNTKKKVGVNNQKWKILNQLGQNINRPRSHMAVEEMGEFGHVKASFNVEKSFGKTINNIDPTQFESHEELYNKIEEWWIKKYRKKETTIKSRITDAKRMARHPVFPINWIEFNPNQIITYLEYREHNEFKPPEGTDQIINEWKVVNTFARAYGISTNNWGYTPPKRRPPKVKIIPLPPTTHKIIHSKYSKDKYVNALFQYVLMHGFLLGLRPSDIVKQKVSDINFDEQWLIVSETKKYGQLRQVFPEKDLFTRKQTKSFKNWIDDWRPKVENQYSGDYLYLQSNGRPFTVNYLRKIITPEVKKIWGFYHLYVMRHWCAISRLIQSYIECKHWDKTDVQEWLGHDHVKTTDSYTKFAKKYYKIAPYDWISFILRPKWNWVDNKENSINGQNKALLNRPTDRKMYAPVGIRTRVAGSKGQNDWPDYTTGALLFYALHKDFHI